MNIIKRLLDVKKKKCYTCEHFVLFGLMGLCDAVDNRLGDAKSQLRNGESKCNCGSFKKRHKTPNKIVISKHL